MLQRNINQYLINYALFCLFSDVIERMRLLYKTCEERLLPVPWCDDFSPHLNDVFTRLKIVNKEKTRGTLTDEITNMTAIFKAHTDCPKPRVVLLEGDPGMGKTTYCQKLAYDWATEQDKWDESFPKIEVLLLLRCHDIKSNIWEAIDDQIIPDDVDKEAKENFFKFIRENQSKVLLVLDGLDEADPSELAMFFKLVERKELPGCHIVFTSRHEAGKKVRRYCDTLWEIVGFTEEDAKTFIRKFFKNMEHLAEELLHKLWPGIFSYSEEYKSLAELTENPLNTALVCILFEDFNGDLPTNRTQLYTEFVLCVLRRYEKKNGLSSSSEDLIAVYKKELILLGCVALQALCKGELYFEEHEFGGNYPLLIKFGFLSIQARGSKRKSCMRCGFLHKSFQEFFAGFYLAFQILKGDTSCDQAVTDERYLNELKEVFLFMFGVVASQCEETTVSLVNSITAHKNFHFGAANSYLKLACECILDIECTTYKESLYSRLVHILGKRLSELLNETSLTQLDLRRNSIGDAFAASLSEALTRNSSLTNLDLSYNSIGAVGAASLSQALTANSSLTNLDLSVNSIGAVGAASLFQALTANSSLTNLDLRGNSIDAVGAASLSQALTANSSLTNLDLSYNSIGAVGAASLSQALTANSSLTNLDLSVNSIGAVGAASLFQALTANSSLTNLNLTYNSIGAVVAASLFQALTANSSLTNLYLRGNSIGDDGAASLSQALTANSSLTNLDLSYNSIGDDGAASLLQALTANSSLTNLDLRGNSIGDDGAASLSQALTANSSLTNLDLSHNSIGAVGAASLLQALTANSSLTNLDLGDNSIGDDGAASLSQALTANSSLTNLDLSYNSIGDDGAASLFQALTANSSLTNLDLSLNSIGDDGAASLFQALTANSSLTNLDLSYNSIGDDGAASLFQALTANSSLTNLDLSDNSIGAAAAASISEACKINKRVRDILN